MKNCSCRFKNLNDVVKNEVVKTKDFNTQNRKEINSVRIKDIDKRNTRYKCFRNYKCLELKKLAIQSRKQIMTQKLLKLKRISLTNIIIISLLLHKLTTESFKERLKQVDLVIKTGFDNKLISFNTKKYLK